ncbi:hypothetical protein CH352_11855 [Leptospira hartskeerlii]|uniref:GmrSD restriction endonucleases N-terminal domain-containing protein n=1 Tax=Leptospira hartskeerlii TaxID=2023177 RepID=A0A2M9XB32_9LEPT|nr:DUF262 domain-containing protein [Leptospira hartskeerlii]PJZ24886.1 hypothetical protein CH357_15025 [Leptospira hartskeerlii]PJZ33022.1 hypothetical protein CH352_11855 [Leptospira hartskeerlii]
MKDYLSTTHRKVAWFKNSHEKSELDMKPPYQRNPVWVNRQKSFLIDSILRGYPIPEIYMQEIVNEKGEMKFIVIDGQQRIRAILDFLYDSFEIDEVDSPEWANLKFSELKAEEKKRIYEYNFIVRVIPDIEDTEIRSIFQRLNRNVISLNKQELRQSTYWGPFIQTMNSIAEFEIWGELGIFTSNDIRRMLDVEFISELAIAVMHGVQNKKETLDKYYSIYESEFEEKDSVKNLFNILLGEVRQVLPNISNTRWSKKTDFYTLFVYFSKNIKQFPLPREKRDNLNSLLISFGNYIDTEVSADEDNKLDSSISILDSIKLYASNVRASSDLGSRKRREEAFANVVSTIFS